MSRPHLLTIIVPTYNRARCLELLLKTLAHETTGLEDRVRILVSDNASTDDTADVVEAFKALVPGCTTIRHPSNLGPDENFCRCVEQTSSRYFWIIGDDDLPRAGAVARLLSLLDDNTPDLVYLQSDWRPGLVDNEPESPVAAEAPLLLDQLDFARRVHVWTTFISGVVINRETFVATHGADALRRFRNTNLVQLGWVLETLRIGSRFVVTQQKFVLATQGNTGGYSVLTVFGVNFASIVTSVFGAGSGLTRAMLRRNAVMFMPSLLWSLRFGLVGTFAAENVDSALRPALGRSVSFWLLLRPISRWPRPAATLLLRACAVLSRLIGLHDRALARLFARKGLA